MHNLSNPLAAHSRRRRQSVYGLVFNDSFLGRSNAGRGIDLKLLGRRALDMLSPIGRASSDLEQVPESVDKQAQETSDNLPP
jgi:hypothetical protein